RFGNAVAISLDTIVVGAYQDDILTNADQGSAYVFTNGPGGWAQSGKLAAASGKKDDLFGTSVGIDGTTVVVGAPSNPPAPVATFGAAYAFTKGLNEWNNPTQVQLTAADGFAGDSFGSAVAVSGSTIVVGAPLSTGFSQNN